MGNNEKFTTVIMDGSDGEVVKAITKIMEMLLIGTGEHADVHPVDELHPTMIAVEIMTAPKNFPRIRCALDHLYPGLCIYNPAA